MTMRFISNFRSASIGAGAFLALATVQPVHADEGSGMRLGAAGWLGYGSIAASIDTGKDYDIVGKPMISNGAQVLLQMMPSENLEIQAGIGAGGGHRLAASLKTVGGYAPYGVGPYVAQANFTYHGWKEDESALFFRGGLFSFDYAKENQNLGLYLLRGPVYPGFLISGFETKHVLPVANTLGLHFHHRSGIFQQDVLLMVETDFYPYYDISPVYIATVQPGSAFRMSAGINFHHLIPVDPELTTDTVSMRYVDASGPVPDTVQLSAKGIKLMMNASLDLKALFGFGDALGQEDLKIYGEAAVIGLGGIMRDDFYFGGAPRLKKNSKTVYEGLYGPISQRMPVMFGINLPTFKFLDRLAFEVQHYGAPFKDDLEMFEATKSVPPPGVIPLDPDSSITRDNIKWSLYGSKVIHNHIKISVQAASDHFRPGIFTGYGDNYPPKSTAVLFRPQDWYWMTKIAYFF
jgi:hypothetical protein